MSGDRDQKRPQDSPSSQDASQDTLPDVSQKGMSGDTPSESRDRRDETAFSTKDMGESSHSSDSSAEADSDEDPSLTDDLYAAERGEIPPHTDEASAASEKENTQSEADSESVSSGESSEALGEPWKKGHEDDGTEDESSDRGAIEKERAGESFAQNELGGQEPEDEPEADEEEEDDDELSSSRMPLTAHLLDLRKRMVRSFLAMAVGFIGCYPFSKELFGYLMAPMTEVLKTSNFIYTYPPEAFFTYIKVSLVAGVFATSPFIFYQMWQFIAPGLYEHERKVLIPIAFLSAVFFVAGACFGYFVVFPFGFDFFASFSTENIVFTPKLSEYLGFSLKLLFAFGIVFEMPIFVLFLAKLGLCTAKGMRRYRKYAILMSFVVSALLTPPDVITQSLMAGPLILLYEISILVAYIFGKKEKPAPENEPEEPEEDKEAKADESSTA